METEPATLEAVNVGPEARSRLREMAAAMQAAVEEAEGSLGRATRARLQKNGSANLGDPNNAYSSAPKDFGKELCVIGAVRAWCGEVGRKRRRGTGVVDSVSNLILSQLHKPLSAGW